MVIESQELKRVNDTIRTGIVYLKQLFAMIRPLLLPGGKRKLLDTMVSADCFIPYLTCMYYRYNIVFITCVRADLQWPFLQVCFARLMRLFSALIQLALSQCLTTSGYSFCQSFVLCHLNMVQIVNAILVFIIQPFDIFSWSPLFELCCCSLYRF